MRTARYDAQRVLWRVTKIRRFAYCGRVLNAAGKAAGGVSVRVTGAVGTPEARAGFSGLQTCGSVWSCPVCSEKVNARRQVELEQALEKWIANGGAVVFGTFTLRHHAGQSLDVLWNAVSPAWSKVTSGGQWSDGKGGGDAARFGIAGWARLVEVKHGDKGWHPHVHALFFLDNDPTDDELDQLRARMFGRWSKQLGKAGLSALEFDRDGHAVGVDLRRVRDAEYIADYFAKNGYHPAASAPAGAAYELTGSQSKTAGKGGRTPFEILADVVIDKAHEVDRDTGEIVVDKTTGELLDDAGAKRVRRNLALWYEWEETSRGRRQLTWSKGLRDLVGLDAEQTDEEVVEEDALNGTEVSLIGEADWKAGRWSHRRHELLRWAEDGEVSDRLAAWRTKQRLVKRRDDLSRRLT